MRRYTPGRDPFYGVSAEAIAAAVDVHITTARRWKRGEEPPHAARIVIDLMTGEQDLGVLFPEWRGWRIKEDKLYGPNDVGYAPGEILATDYWRTLIRHYQAEQRLPRQADWVDEVWQPAVELDNAVSA